MILLELSATGSPLNDPPLRRTLLLQKRSAQTFTHPFFCGNDVPLDAPQPVLLFQLPPSANTVAPFLFEVLFLLWRNTLLCLVFWPLQFVSTCTAREPPTLCLISRAGLPPSPAPPISFSPEGGLPPLRAGHLSAERRSFSPPLTKGAPARRRAPTALFFFGGDGKS